MTPPPITIVAHNVGGIGGMERQLDKLINGTLAAGGEVTVISRTCRLPAHSRLRWIRIPGPNRPFAVAFTWFYIAATIVAAVRKRGLLHGTGALVGNKLDLTTVHFCHLGVRRRQGRYMRAGRGTLTYTLNAHVARWLSEASERWSYRPGRIRRIVAVSDGVVGELRESFPKVADVTMMIPNGVDLDVFHPDADARAEKRAALGLAESDLAAIFVGGDWTRKGLEHAIEAVGRRPAWHLIVAGAGAIGEYTARAEAAGAKGRVHFLGAVPDVNRYLAAADAFIFPTRYEAAPLVSYEAAASGLPLLVTPVNGVEDFLREGVNGWFIGQDADSIERRLAELEASPELIRSMGREARAAVEHFEWDAVVTAYAELYAELAGRTAVTPGRPAASR